MVSPRTSLEASAYAKINLSLDVLAHREDGFHELRSIMQTVSTCDTIHFSLQAGCGRDTGQENDYSLIDRALDAVASMRPSARSVAYQIEKRIPSAAGLGGGSSDCAVALRSAAYLLGADVSDQELLDLSAGLGSDVPFFLTGGTALVEGRGERITSLPDAPMRWFLLANCGEPVSTADVFRELSSFEYGNGGATARAQAALARGAVEFGGNDLTEAAIRVCPAIESTLEAVRAAAKSDHVALSGSGGTVAAMFEDMSAARAVRDALAGTIPYLEVAVSIDRQTFQHQWEFE